MRRSIARAGLAAGAVSCACAIAVPAASAAVRHAAPGASGPDPCAPAAPCSFADAVSGAAAGDEVLVAPGNHVVSSTVNLSANAVVVRGAAATPRPRVSSTGSTLLFVTGSGSTVRDLRLEAIDAPSEYVVNDLASGNLYERVEVVATGTTGVGVLLRDGSTVRDSVVWARGADATAVMTASFPHVPVAGAKLERVTAVGGSEEGLGVAASSCFGDKQLVTLVDVIARGGGPDVRAEEICDLTPDPDPPAIEVRVGSTNAAELVAHSGAEIHELGGNQTAAPVFSDAANGDFHQNAGSPTIDAGRGPIAAGALDLDLQPRLLGSAPDIGADEFAPPPPPDAPIVDQPGEPPAAPPPAGSIDADPPVLGPLSMTRRRFAVTRRGTAFRFSVSEDARVTVVIRRTLRGRRSGGRCSPRAGRGRRCTVHRRAGRLVRTLPAGTARVAFKGRIGRRALRPGRYRATIGAVDAAGNAAKPRSIRFVIVRR